ncbi:hypothetical protein J644_3901, partial [Acinetobacter baumannii 480175]
MRYNRHFGGFFMGKFMGWKGKKPTDFSFDVAKTA